MRINTNKNNVDRKPTDCAKALIWISPILSNLLVIYTLLKAINVVHKHAQKLAFNVSADKKTNKKNLIVGFLPGNN